MKKQYSGVSTSSVKCTAFDVAMSPKPIEPCLTSKETKQRGLAKAAVNLESFSTNSENY